MNTMRACALRAQIIPFGLIGIVICVYGKPAQNLYAIMVALFTANYGSWVSSFASIKVDFDDYGQSMWKGIDRGVFLTITTLLALIAAESNGTVKELQKAFVLGQTLITVLLDFLQTALLTEEFGCKLKGAKSEYFPTGSPISCDTTGLEVTITFQSLRVTNWALTALLMKISGMNCSKKAFERAVFAMVGSTLFWKTLIDMLNTIIATVDPDIIAEINFIFPTIKLPLVYGSAVLGFLYQTRWRDVTPKNVKEMKKAPRLLRLTVWVDDKVGRILEKLAGAKEKRDSTEGGMKLWDGPLQKSKDALRSSWGRRARLAASVAFRPKRASKEDGGMLQRDGDAANQGTPATPEMMSIAAGAADVASQAAALPSPEVMSTAAGAADAASGAVAARRSFFNRSRCRTRKGQAAPPEEVRV